MNDRPLVTRIRDLAKADKLEQLLHLPDADADRLPWPEWFAVVQWVAWVSAGIAVGCFALEERPAGTDADLDHPSIYAALLLIAFGALCWLLSKLTVSRAARRRRRLGRRGTLAPGAIVQAHSGWYADGNEDPWPASVVTSLDPAARAEPQRLADVAAALAALKQADRRALPDDQVAVAWQLYHEFIPVRTVPVPPALSAGLSDCWLATVTLPGQPLWHDDLLVALLLPGDPSPDAIAVLPDAVARG